MEKEGNLQQNTNILTVKLTRSFYIAISPLHQEHLSSFRDDFKKRLTNHRKGSGSFEKYCRSRLNFYEYLVVNSSEPAREILNEPECLL